MATRTVSVSSRVFGEVKSKKKSTTIEKGKGSETISSRSDIHKIVDEIKQMKSLKNVPLKNLDQKNQQKLADIRKAALLLRRGKNYDTIVDAIKTNYQSTNDVRPDTVGAFFFGCFLEQEGDENLACAAHCAGNMPVPIEPGWRDCEKSVGIYDSGELTIKYINEKSNGIIIHDISGSFQGLNGKDLKKLSDISVDTITLVSPKSSSSEDQSKSTMSGHISLFSSASYSKGSDYSRTIPDKIPERKEESWWGIIAFVVIFLIIIFFVAVFWMYRKSVSSAAVPVSSTVGFGGPGYTV
jgi:hypothetical protein